MSFMVEFWDFFFTHISHINFPISISISRTSLFQILGVLVGIFHFYSNFKRNFCEQTVELRLLIWVCPLCLCPRLIWDKEKHFLKGKCQFFQQLRMVVLKRL